MKTAPLRDWILDAVPLVVAVGIAWQVVSTWLGRVDHPYDLEWMEGGMLGHAWQISQGLPLYAEPSLNHVAFVYPPGYASLVAALEPVFGLDYPLGRWISIASSLVATALVALGGWRHGGRLAPALCAAALYLATYNAAGGFHDIVRPDPLGIALLGGAILLGLERYRGAAVASGLLLCAAWVVKHNLAAFGVVLLPAIWLRSGRAAALRFTAASAGSALALTAWLQYVNDGRFLDFLLGLPASHPMVGARAFPGGPGELAIHLLPAVVAGSGFVLWRAAARVPPTALGIPAVACVFLGVWGLGVERVPGVAQAQPWELGLSLAAMGAGAGASVVVLVDQSLRQRPDWRWVAGTGAMGIGLVVALVMRAHHGGFLNVYMPIHWLICLGVGVAMGRSRVARPGVTTSALTAAALLACLQWTGATLELERLLPTAEDRIEGDRIVAEIAACDGPVFSPQAAWLPVQAGRGGPSAHQIGMWDINHEGGPFRASLQTYRTAARNHHWACVVQSGRPIKQGIDTNYRVDRRIAPRQPGVLRTKTGWRTRPEVILVPR